MLSLPQRTASPSGPVHRPRGNTCKTRSEHQHQPRASPIPHHPNSHVHSSRMSMHHTIARNTVEKSHIVGNHSRSAGRLPFLPTGRRAGRGCASSRLGWSRVEARLAATWAWARSVLSLAGQMRCRLLSRGVWRGGRWGGWGFGREISSQVAIARTCTSRTCL